MDTVLEKMSAITGVKYSDEQLRVLEHKGGMCIVACAGSGKALCNGTLVMTDTGKVPVQWLRPGDFVLGSEGTPVEVLGVYPQGKKPLYRITFSDNSSVQCSPDHLWTITVNGRDETLTLQEIITKYCRKLKRSEVGIHGLGDSVYYGPVETDIRIPTAKFVDRRGPRKDIKGDFNDVMGRRKALTEYYTESDVDPYVLGVIISNYIQERSKPYYGVKYSGKGNEKQEIKVTEAIHVRNVEVAYYIKDLLENCGGMTVVPYGYPEEELGVGMAKSGGYVSIISQNINEDGTVNDEPSKQYERLRITLEYLFGSESNDGCILSGIGKKPWRPTDTTVSYSKYMHGLDGLSLEDRYSAARGIIENMASVEELSIAISRADDAVAEQLWKEFGFKPLCYTLTVPINQQQNCEMLWELFTSLGCTVYYNMFADNIRVCVTTSRGILGKLHEMRFFNDMTRRFEVERLQCSARFIKHIEEAGYETEMTCISVADDRHLFTLNGGILTHNTTTLCHLLVKRIMTGEIEDTRKLLVTTYSVAGREELQARVNALLSKMGVLKTVEIRTLHSAYYKILKTLNMLGKMATNAQRMLAITQALKACNIRLEDDDVKVLDSLLSYQINNMMTDEAVYNDYHFTLDMDLEKYTKVRKEFAHKKAEMGVIDFDDLQLHVYVAMKNSETVRDYVASLWDHFYIDEFQDVSKLQFEILRMMLRDPRKLVVIGDDDQCIYQWRGADPNIILNIYGVYDIERFLLSTNYRCGSEIVNRANCGIQNNKNRYTKQMVPFNKGGSVGMIESSGESLGAMSGKAFTKIRELIISGVAEEDISVLCRNNAHAIILNNMLLGEGIIHRASQDVRFHQYGMVKDLKAAVEIGNNTRNFNMVNSVMWKLVPFLSSKNGQIIGKFMRDCGCTFIQALKAFLIQFGDLYSDSPIFKDNLPEIDVDVSKIYQTRVSSESLQALVNIYTDIVSTDDPVVAARKMIKRYIMTTVDFLYKTDDMKKTVIGLSEYFNKLLDRGIDAYEEHMDKTVHLEEFEVEPERKCINLSTMHGSKGKEWKHVIILGADGISCPGKGRIQGLIANNTPESEILNYIEQERRLFYVAMTRAKEELTFIQDLECPSPFLLEALGISISADGDNNRAIMAWARLGSYMTINNANIKGAISDKLELYSYNTCEAVAENEAMASGSTVDTDGTVDVDNYGDAGYDYENDGGYPEEYPGEFENDFGRNGGTTDETTEEAGRDNRQNVDVTGVNWAQSHVSQSVSGKGVELHNPYLNRNSANSGSYYVLNQDNIGTDEDIPDDTWGTEGQDAITEEY